MTLGPPVPPACPTLMSVRRYTTQHTAIDVFMEDHVLTTSQAARLLGISVRTAQLLIEAGTLPSWKTPGGHRRVYRAEVQALLSRSQTAPAPASAMVMVVAAERRQPRFAAALAAQGALDVQMRADEWAAMLELGALAPAAVVIDLADSTDFAPDAAPDSDARLAMLARLAADARLGETLLVVVRPAARRLDPATLPARVRVATLRELPGLLRGVTGEAGDDKRNDGDRGVNQRGDSDGDRDADRDGGGVDDDRADALARLGLEFPVTYPVAPNEGRRLRAVERSGLLDTGADAAFDRITWLAAQALDMPIALMTLVAPTRQWFKSRRGIALTESPRSVAFCNHTILQRRVFMVQDLSQDPAFTTSPVVAGAPYFRFYAGAPVLDADGFALGSICVMDYRPRTLDAAQCQMLEAFAAIASSEVRALGMDRDLRRTREQLQRRERLAR